MAGRPATPRTRAARAAAVPEPLEKVLQHDILDLCKLLGLRTAHFPPLLTPKGRWITAGQGDAKGFPDLVVVGPGGVLFAELKKDRGPVAPEQRKWQVALAEAGAQVVVWRTRDWRDGTIQQTLQQLRRKAA